MHTTIRAAAAVGLALGAVGGAGAASLGVYPIQQLIGYQGEGTQRQMMEPAFVAAIQQKGAPFFVAAFVSQFRQRFGATAAATIDSHNRLRTFAASLQLTRASHYQVQGLDGTVTHFLPVTLSLNITNPLSGEVVYSVSRTRYEMLKLTAAAPAEQVRAQQVALYQRNVLQLIEAVVAEAAEKFKPTEIRAGVQKVWHEALILDRGLDVGIGPGDDLQDANGQLIKVVHAGNGYAVAVPVLVTQLDAQASFAKYTTMGVGDIRKPKVLVLPEAARRGPSGADDVVVELFGQLLGRDTAFTLTPVNRNHQQVLNALDRETQLGQVAAKQNRALPEYFIRLRSMPFKFYEVPTNSPTVKHRLYEAMAFGELLDNAGAVVYATTARARIDDEIVNGAGFDVQARHEVMLKNVVTELAQQFGRGVRFRQVSAPVAQVLDGQRVVVTDASDALSDGATVRVFRSVPGVGSGEPVRVPIWEAQVLGRTGHAVELALVLPLTAAMPKDGVLPEVGDVVLVQEAGRPTEQSVRFEPCAADDDQIGSFKIPDFGRFAYFQFGEQAVSPFYSRWQEIKASIEDLTRTAGFRDTLKVQEPKKVGYCIQPGTKIEVQKQTCEGGLCSFKVSATMAFGVKGPGDVKPRYFAKKIEPVLSNVPEVGFETVIASHLMESAPVLLKDSARQLQAQHWGQ